MGDRVILYQMMSLPYDSEEPFVPGLRAQCVQWYQKRQDATVLSLGPRTPLSMTCCIHNSKYHMVNLEKATM